MFCHECGTEVKDDAKFCPKCGSNVKEIEQTENTINSSIDVKPKSNGVLSFLDDWHEWSTLKKIGSIIVVCCIGLIIIGAIGGILFPDSNTSEHRYYMQNSSFLIPDDCSVREGGGQPGVALLVRDDGSEVTVFDYYPPHFDSSEHIDSNDTFDVDGVTVNKIKFHYNNGLSFTDYFFTKDNIDYRVVFNDETTPDDNLVRSIVKTMDTTHGSLNDHENVFTVSEGTDKEDRYDSYTGSSNSNSNSGSSDTNDNLGDSDVQVRIICKGGWSGTIGVGTSSSTYSGKGDKIINLDGSSSDIVAAVIQKDNGGNGKLKVEIIKNGNVKKESSTTAGYGVVSVAD